MEKEKEKGIPLIWARGMDFGPPRARARAEALSAQRRPTSEGGNGAAARVTASHGAHLPAREGERDGVTVDGGDEPAVRGEDLAAGGLGGGSPPVAWFLGNV